MRVVKGFLVPQYSWPANVRNVARVLSRPVLSCHVLMMMIQIIHKWKITNASSLNWVCGGDSQ